MDSTFSKYDVYTTVGSMYCYKGINVLYNRFGVRDSAVLHKYLFGDINAFAGHFRKESIAKGKTTFEAPLGIKPKLTKLLAELRREYYLQDAGVDFITRLAYYFAELNYIHPFREGNGRATREFVRLLLLRNGYAVDWSAVSIEVFLDAMEASVFDISGLIAVLEQCISVRTI